MEGRSVLVAGATGGLGSAIAANLADRGATLTLVSRRSERLRTLDVRGHRVALDLRDPSSCEDAVQAAIDHAGRLDAVVNAVGTVAFGPVDELTVDAMEELFMTNTFIPIMLAKAAFGALDQGGVIVNISGVIAEQNLPGMAAYGASKAAVRSFDEALAREARRARDPGDRRPTPAHRDRPGIATDRGPCPEDAGRSRPRRRGRNDLRRHRGRCDRPSQRGLRSVMSVLVISTAATWGMVGVIWMVQVVHYPMLAQYSAGAPVRAVVDHQRRIAPVVGPFMAAEGVTALILLVDRPATMGAASALAAAALLGVALLSTIAIQVPLHSRLAEDHDDELARTLITTNWLRTAAWTARGVLLAAVLAT